MKLWSKDKTSTAAQIETFTVGRDRDFDVQMAGFDVEGSIAHVTMLGEQGLMSKEQADLAVAELKNILTTIEAGEFSIDAGKPVNSPLMPAQRISIHKLSSCSLNALVM